MVEIKYKKISESSLNYFSKIIYSDILKYYMDKQRSDIKKQVNLKIKIVRGRKNERSNLCKIFL